MIPFLKKNKDGKKPPKSTVPRTAQESIPIQRMFEDGTCRVRPGYYTRTIQYQDINYQLSQNEDKTAIFEAWCDFLNYFDSSVQFQLSFVNLSASQETFARSISIPPCGDEFDGIRAEYAGMLQNQLARGNNGSVKTKYITYTIEADNLKAARARLSHISLDIQGYFKIMGAVSRVLDGKERLEVLHGIFHPDGEPFRFDWDWLAPSGLSTKDFVAPSSLCFGTAKTFGLGGKYGAVSFLQILAPELSDEMLADFLKTESGILVNLHVQAIDQTEAIKTIKRKITDLDAMKIQEQKKAVRSGYDMDILPSDLATYGEDAKKLLNKLQTRNERLFMLTFLVLNVADTKQKLGNDVFLMIEHFPIPVIAAVNGFALGGGNELAMSCDIILAAGPNAEGKGGAKFGQPEVGLGITPGFSGTQRLPRRVGVAKAKELIFSGKQIGAEEAKRIGLVNEVYAAEELLNKAVEMAKSFTANAPIAVKYSKACIDRGMQMDIDNGIALENELFAMCFATEDQKEGMGAFLEKRKEKHFQNKGAQTGKRPSISLHIKREVRHEKSSRAYRRGGGAAGERRRYHRHRRLCQLRLP